MIRQSSTYMAIWEDGYIDIIRLKLLYRMNITVSFNGENVSSYQLQEHTKTNPGTLVMQVLKLPYCY